MLGNVARRDRRGLTLIEAALVLGVTAVVFGGFAEALSVQAENGKSKAVADRLTEVTQAAQNYMMANQSALLGYFQNNPNGTFLVPVGKTCATCTAPGAANGLKGVQSGGFLPDAFIDSNAYGQTHVLVFRYSQTGSPHIEGMVFTDSGNLIPDRQIGRVARFVGAQGGFMMQNPGGANYNAGYIVGTAGGWSSPASLWQAPGEVPTPGHAMAYLSSQDNALTGEYLNRYNTGDAEANTMRTDLHLGNNNIDGANKIAGNTVVTNSVTAQDGNLLTIGPNIDVPGYIQAGGPISTPQAVTGSEFIDASDPNFYVQPSASAGPEGGSHLNQATIEDLVPHRLDVDAEIYGDSRGIPSNANIPIRLGDLLPTYVAKGQYYWTDTDNVILKPTCATGGLPVVQVTLLTDSYSFDTAISSNTLLPKSDFGQGGPVSADGVSYFIDLFNNDPLVTSVSGASNQVARKVAAKVYDSTHWVVDVTGSQGMQDGAHPMTGLASTFCDYAPLLQQQQ